VGGGGLGFCVSHRFVKGVGFCGGGRFHAGGAKMVSVFGGKEELLPGGRGAKSTDLANQDRNTPPKGISEVGRMLGKGTLTRGH